MLTARSFGFLPRQAMLFLVICEDDIDGKGMHMLLLLETLSITTLYTYIYVHIYVLYIHMLSNFLSLTDLCC